MKVVCVSNQKGGTGKTTTSVNLAAALAEGGSQRVLLIDMDPQANTSAWYGVEHEQGRALFDALCGEGALIDAVVPSTVEGVDLIASGDWLIKLESTLLGDVGSEFCVREALASLPQDRWDIVIIDSTPSLGLLVVSALAAADEVLVPVEMQIMPVSGLAALTRTVDRVRDRLNPKLRYAGILSCRAKPRTNLFRELRESLVSAFGDVVLDTTIRENVKLGEAPSFQQPITEYDTRSTGAQDYRALAGELSARWKKQQQPSQGGDKWAA